MILKKAESVETGLEIAVIGMAGRFPGARNIEEFWTNLTEGQESITFFTDEELLEAGVNSELLNHPNYVKAKGLMPGSEDFDSAFFGYSPSKAAKMDPQIRVFHECAWVALEDAGYDPETYDGLIGLYAGISSNFYWQAQNVLGEVSGVSERFANNLLANKDFFSTRISYKLNLKGPSVTMHTACSTSLVTIHQACQALLSAECDLALAGGVSITFPQKSGYMYQPGMILSKDGHCRSFDADASGTIQGDGVGIVVLKPLEDALNDGDNIYAVIKGSAINNDGRRKVGYTAPSVSGQVEVIRAAQRMAEVEAESIGYIEAHGTGTNLGDPVEIEGMKTAFNTKRTNFLWYRFSEE